MIQDLMRDLGQWAGFGIKMTKLPSVNDGNTAKGELALLRYWYYRFIGIFADRFSQNPNYDLHELAELITTSPMGECVNKDIVLAVCEVFMEQLMNPYFRGYFFPNSWESGDIAGLIISCKGNLLEGRGHYQDLLKTAIEDQKQFLVQYNPINMNIKRNVGKNIWNRSLKDDFYTFDIVEKCVYCTLNNYRTTDADKDNRSLYKEVLNIQNEDKYKKTFAEKIHKLLCMWNMNTRGAKLKGLESFKSILMKKNTVDVLEKLEQYQLEDWDNDFETLDKLLKEFFNLVKVSDTNSFVSNTKVLHFYLPRLFIPIDRTYTLNYFTDWRNVDPPKDVNLQVQWIESIHIVFAKFFKEYQERFRALESEIQQFPVTKLLDDMIIGFSILRDEHTKSFKL